MLFFTTKVSNNEIEIQETLFQVTRSKSFSLHSKLFLCGSEKLLMSTILPFIAGCLL